MCKYLDHTLNKLSTVCKPKYYRSIHNRFIKLHHKQGLPGHDAVFKFCIDNS